MINKKLIIHIGLHKTGTTSIQTFLKESTILLRKHGVRYIAGAGKSHQNIAYEVKNSRQFNPEGVTLELAANEIRANEHNKYIISSEALSSMLVGDIRSIVNTLGVPACCVIYLRPQDEFIESIYTQSVKTAREKRSFHDFIKCSDLYAQFDYKDKIDPWAEVLGDENIYVRSYASSALFKGDSVSDFFALLGIDIEPGRRSWENLSMGARATALCAAVWAESPKLWPNLSKNERDRLVGHNLRKAVGDAFTDDLPFVGFEYNERIEIRNMFDESNKEIESRFSVNLDWPIKKADSTAHCIEDISQHDLVKVIGHLLKYRM